MLLGGHHVTAIWQVSGKGETFNSLVQPGTAHTQKQIEDYQHGMEWWTLQALLEYQLRLKQEEKKQLSTGICHLPVHCLGNSCSLEAHTNSWDVTARGGTYMGRSHGSERITSSSSKDISWNCWGVNWLVRWNYIKRGKLPAQSTS